MGLAKIPEDDAKQAEDRLRQLKPMARDLATIHSQPVGEKTFQRKSRLRRESQNVEISKLESRVAELEIKLAEAQAAELALGAHLAREAEHILQLRRRDIDQQRRIGLLQAELSSGVSLRQRLEASEREVLELRLRLMSEIVGKRN